MRISDWSSDVCSSDLEPDSLPRPARPVGHARSPVSARARLMEEVDWRELDFNQPFNRGSAMRELGISIDGVVLETEDKANWLEGRSEEHTSELQSLMRISYAVFCLKKKKPTTIITITRHDSNNILYNNHTYMLTISSMNTP